MSTNISRIRMGWFSALCSLFCHGPSSRVLLSPVQHQHNGYHWLFTLHPGSPVHLIRSAYLSHVLHIWSRIRHRLRICILCSLRHRSTFLQEMAVSEYRYNQRRGSCGGYLPEPTGPVPDHQIRLDHAVPDLVRYFTPHSNPGNALQKHQTIHKWRQQSCAFPGKRDEVY